MGVVSYLWDTNTVIYFLQNQFSKNAEVFTDKLYSNQRPILSLITEIELLCWKTANESDFSKIKDLKLLNPFDL